MGGCSIRAIWILNNLDAVAFSRRFPVVENQWRSACKKQEHEDKVISCPLPNDGEVAKAFVDRKQRDGSVCGYGIRIASSSKGSDSWVDDPITRHIISLQIDRNAEDAHEFLLWPLVLHIKGQYRILVLPLVEPVHLMAYVRICQRTDCGNPNEVKENCLPSESLSSLLLNLPCITGAFMVAQALGDVVTGEVLEPEMIVNPPPSVGGLLDSLTGSMGITGIAARAKPVAAPLPVTATVSSAATGTIASDLSGSKGSSRSVDKDGLRNFISSSIPFGTPLDLGVTNLSTMRANGFSSLDLPPTDLKQPAWKPYLFRGKQRILFMIHELVSAAMYDRDDVPDVISISGQINCRADLEGLPDVSLPLTGMNAAHVEAVSFHPCAQVSEQGVDKQALIFSPPLGNFVLVRYQASLSNLSPPIKGFYQLSMVSEDEGAFLFKLKLMEGYKAPIVMEYCSVTMPFPRRKIVLIDGNPSVGTVSTTEHSVEWKIIVSGRSGTAKSIEATFPGTIKFAPKTTNRYSYRSKLTEESVFEEESDSEGDGSNGLNNIEEFLEEKMNKDLNAVELEEPFTWEAYNFAKVSFKLLGGTMSGMSVDPKAVTIYPVAKVPCEFSAQVLAGEYILWNSLGRYPHAASPKFKLSKSMHAINYKYQATK
ncbi:AP-5 complex subunit mu isoform X2 [Cryptomeria japonica]|uniref:AP-5 complex subunit mu isoform X2 n=1 Tax=Cryptomeria japonica TaxID=3369 RepID=UPI0027DA156D|nr:AP-5 complex subunit mu isoform X2 [Cryptomeria japonica]